MYSLSYIIVSICFRSNDVTEDDLTVIQDGQRLYLEFEISFFDSVKRTVFLLLRTFTYLRISKKIFWVFLAFNIANIARIWPQKYLSIGKIILGSPKIFFRDFHECESSEEKKHSPFYRIKKAYLILKI